MASAPLPVTLWARAFGIPAGPLPLFALTLTIGAYLLGVAVQRRTGLAVLNPVLIAIVLIGAVLLGFHIPYAVYFQGAQALHFLLGPATVALAIPLVRAIEHIRRALWPMLAALLAGAVASVVSGYGLVRLCGGSRELALSMVPKSLTTPIALEVSHTIGGLPALTAVFAILAGVLVAVGIHHATALIRVRDPAAIGLAAGLAGSGVGASRVLDHHPLSGAFAAVAIGLNGLLTAAIAPALVRLLTRW